MELRKSDLIRDDLGNYYVIESINEKKLIIVNAVIHHSYRRTLSHDFVDEVSDKYNKQVAVGHYFQDALKDRVAGLKSGRYPGKIHDLSTVATAYEVELNAFYERDMHA